MVGLTTDAKRVRQLSGEKLEAIEWETRKPAVAGRNQRDRCIPFDLCIFIES